MDERLLEQLERIAAAGIQLLPTPELPHHFVFERAGCVVLVERRTDGFGGIGSPGALTGRGFEALVERAAGPAFVFKGDERAATANEAEAARSLLRDLRQALT
jgi:hypothetical protein